MKTKRILVIGAAESCIGIIKTINQMGHISVVVSTAAEAPAKPFASQYYVFEENDVDGVVELCDNLEVDALVPTPVDRTLHWMGHVAKRCGLIFLSIEAIDRFRDKSLMKERFMQKGIPCARGIKTNPEEFQMSFINDFEFPLIVKPLDAYASRGVLKVENMDQLQTYIHEASAFSTTGNVLIEEFIEGREFNAEGICYNGEVEIYAVVEKISGEFPRTIEMGHVIPADIRAEEEQLIVETITAAVKALGMVNGAFNAEIKLNNGKGIVIEIAGRLAGDFIVSHLVPPTTGQDMNKAVVEVHLGLQPEKALRTYPKFGMISYYNLPEGKTIKEVKNFSHLLNQPNVIWIRNYFSSGDKVPEVMHMGHRSGLVIIVEKSREQLFWKAEEIKNELIQHISFE